MSSALRCTTHPSRPWQWRMSWSKVWAVGRDGLSWAVTSAATIHPLILLPALAHSKNSLQWYMQVTYGCNHLCEPWTCTLPLFLSSCTNIYMLTLGYIYVNPKWSGFSYPPWTGHWMFKHLYGWAKLLSGRRWLNIYYTSNPGKLQASTEDPRGVSPTTLTRQLGMWPRLEVWTYHPLLLNPGSQGDIWPWSACPARVHSMPPQDI